jgi:hypothetical protein
MDYYLLNEADGSHLGPYSLSQLRMMWERGHVTLRTSYWVEGMEAWMPLRDLEGALMPPPVVSGLPEANLSFVASDISPPEGPELVDPAQGPIMWNGKEVDMLGIPLYYQEEFRKIHDSKETYQGKWNWYAFWFGVLWALTKSLWTSAVISLVAAVLLGLATCGAGALLVGIIYQFIYGYRGNYIYYCAHVKNKQLPV